MKLVIDTETTRQKNPITGRDDPSPYNPANKLVSVQIKNLETGEKVFYPFYHKENTIAISVIHELVQKWLNAAELLIGHNLKFDMGWLYACGFNYTGAVYDTMIFEYVS